MRIKIILTILLTLSITFTKAQDDNYVKGLKAFDAKDYEKAVEYLRAYAESGDCLAQYAVGFCYSYGKSSFANDSIAEIFLLGAAKQKQTHAMGILATLYFKKSYSDKSYNIQALVWAETAAKYDVIQKGTTTRYVIREYMTKEEIGEAEKIIEKRKMEFDNMKDCS